MCCSGWWEWVVWGKRVVASGMLQKGEWVLKVVGCGDGAGSGQGERLRREELGSAKGAGANT